MFEDTNEPNELVTPSNYMEGDTNKILQSNLFHINLKLLITLEPPPSDTSL